MSVVDSLSVMVVQTGARRSYAVPRMLERAGVLSAFFTTFAFPDSVQARLIANALKVLLFRKAGSIDRRRVYGVSPERVNVALFAEFDGLVAKIRSGSSLDQRLRVSRHLGSAVCRTFTSGPNVALIVDDSGGPEMIRTLKGHGLKVALDMVVTPLAHEQTYLAAQEFPVWRGATYSTAERARYLHMYREVIREVDLILYPSLGVLEGLKAIPEFDPGRAVHVPYPLGTTVERQVKPVPGRILFAGSDPLRKGLPYLAHAAIELRNRGLDIQVVIAGQVPDKIKSLPECQSLMFLGHLSRTEMKNEMAKADIFCLPSLAEGTAQVTLEALAAGVPCVVTLSAGAPVVNNVNGFVIPERNVAALADSLAELVNDRSLRARLSCAAAATAIDFQEAVVAQRLVRVLHDLHLGSGR